MRMRHWMPRSSPPSSRRQCRNGRKGGSIPGHGEAGLTIGTTTVTPLYIGSEIYRNSSYGPKHPLAVPRVSVCTDLCRALGWLPDGAYRDAPMATDQELTR